MVGLFNLEIQMQHRPSDPVFYEPFCLDMEVQPYLMT